MVGRDSHAPTGGAFGTFIYCIGATQMLGILMTGEIRPQVPQTLYPHWNGQLVPRVTAGRIRQRGLPAS